MKFKLDENFGTRTQRVFREAGHDVQTVSDQKLHGATDQKLYEVCCREKRCLVTLDLDFADAIRFPPNKSSGIAIIRTPQNPSHALLDGLIRRLLKTVKEISISRCLWIAEVGRIRIHQTED